MLRFPKFKFGAYVLTSLCAAALVAGVASSSAHARTRTAAVATANDSSLQSAQTAAPESNTHARPNGNSGAHAAAGGRPYFIEFRARSALSYGHTFLVHGRVGQRITAKDVIGLHPIGEAPTFWMIGHVVPVKSETGASDGDFEDEYIIARYRILLTQSEYRTILAHMREMQVNHPLWHAVLYNCNAFVGDIARYMGLKAPANTLAMPKDYINSLKQLNGGRNVLSTSRTAWTPAE